MMSRARSHLRLLFSGAVLLGGLTGSFVSAPALAQGRSAPVVSQPVVQAIPGGEGMKLNDALGRLAKDPRDAAALLDAGKASLDLGDVDAAIGFFQRASTLAPGDARAKAGLAGAYVLKGDPFAAIPLFKEAERDGPIDPARLSDRGLAYDLVGDNQTAQHYYRQSLTLAPTDETARRLAISQAIGGDRRGMELTLSPLLQRQDKAAWRTRAFALAILGYGEEAEAIARQSLPADRAAAMSAYLRYMPRLTAAQQARAGDLGHFPRAAEIGTDDPRVAQYARPRAALAAAPTPAPASAAVKGKTRGRGRTKQAAIAAGSPAPAQASATQAKSPVEVALAPPEPHVGREVAGTPVGELPPVQSGATAPEPAPVAPAPRLNEAARVPLPAAQQTSASAISSPEPARANPAPGFDLRQVAPNPAPAPAPAPKPEQAPAAKAPRQASLEEVFADFTPPSREAEPESGAVDVRKIQAPPPAKEALVKEPAAKDPKAKDARSSDPKAKDAKGKDAKGKGGKDAAKDSAKDAGKDSRLVMCDEPDSAKSKTKGAKGKSKGKGGAKPEAKSAKNAATQCTDAASGKAEKLGKDAKSGKSGKTAKAPAHLSRIWVQIAAGRNKKALAFDWNRWVKENKATFKGRDGYTSSWGATNRLLTGPFETEAAANAFIGKLKKAGFEGVFMWTSPAGQVVDTLP